MSASTVRALYQSPLALFTDLYQLTMAFAHWRAGTSEREAVFHLSLRSAPAGGPFALVAGLDAVADYIEGFVFTAEDLAYLSTLEDARGGRLFPTDFLAALGRLRLSCDVDAVPEGTAVPAGIPVLRARGPLLQVQMLETALLNLLSYPTLVATKAAHLVHAAGGAPVIDFGLRKAHGIDGGATASRAAYLGGCTATSNVLAGRLFGIPVRGTHAHGWVMSFDSELEAFEAYARALPDNCVFLVDTFSSLQGVRHAVEVGRRLQEAGHELIGIRLDSGDLYDLSVQSRRLLDEAGLHDSRILASSSLDTEIITSLRRAGAPIDMWGVGSRLLTGLPDAMLNAVYKLSAVRGADGRWHNRIKLSDSPGKNTLPGIQQVRRFLRQGRPIADVVYDEATVGADWRQACRLDDHCEPLPGDAESHDLLVPVLRSGRRVAALPSLEDARARARREYQRFLGLTNYPVLLEARLHREWRRLQEQLRAPQTGAGPMNAAQGAEGRTK